MVLDDRRRVERGPDDHRREALLRDPIELAAGEQRGVQRQDRDRVHASVGLLREVPDPVVVSLAERGRGLRVVDQREVLVEQRGEHHGLVDAHRVHVGDAGGGVVRAGVDRDVHVGVERTDVVDGLARPPDRLAHEPRAVEVLPDVPFTIVRRFPSSSTSW